MIIVKKPKKNEERNLKLAHKSRSSGPYRGVFRVDGAQGPLTVKGRQRRN